jgi:hypothetical protein
MKILYLIELPVLRYNSDNALFLLFNGMKQAEYNRLDFGLQYAQD